jgi:hypothetical protein
MLPYVLSSPPGRLLRGRDGELHHSAHALSPPPPSLAYELVGHPFPPASLLTNPEPARADVQAILTVIGRRSGHHRDVDIGAQPGGLLTARPFLSGGKNYAHPCTR